MGSTLGRHRAEWTKPARPGEAECTPGRHRMARVRHGAGRHSRLPCPRGPVLQSSPGRPHRVQNRACRYQVRQTLERNRVYRARKTMAFARRAIKKPAAAVGDDYLETPVTPAQSLVTGPLCRVRLRLWVRAFATLPHPVARRLDSVYNLARWCSDRCVGLQGGQLYGD